LLARNDSVVADQKIIKYLVETKRPVWMADMPFRRKNIGRNGKRHPKLAE
jgi:hypothetical protein